MLSKNLIFPPTDSLGDAIVASPIARHFSKMCPTLYVPLHKRVLPTALSLYSEDPNIHVFDYQDHDSLKEYINANDLVSIVGPPIHTIPWNGTWACDLWEEQWYTFYGLSFETRYTGFNIPTPGKKSQDIYTNIVTNKRYILTHTQWGPSTTAAPIDLHSWRESHGLDPLDQFQVIDLNPSISNDLLDYVTLIANAEEIHCVPSCLHHLVDGMVNKTKAKLFYHEMRRNACMRVNNRWNNHRWCMIHYHTKWD